MKRIKYPFPHEIVCLEADINYTIFHLHDGRKVLSSSTLKVHEQELNGQEFVRINRSTVINNAYVLAINHIGKNIEYAMHNGQLIRASRRRAQELRTMGQVV